MSFPPPSSASEASYRAVTKAHGRGDSERREHHRCCASAILCHPNKKNVIKYAADVTFFAHDKEQNPLRSLLNPDLAM